jgi:predicted transcriptional regulator
VDSVVARSILQGLVREEILVQIGERGGAEYRVNPSLSVPARIRHTDVELDQIAMSLAIEAPLTNARLRRATGLDAAHARKVLKRLVEEGELVQRGSRRGTRYELTGL